jgi:predicted permease
MLIRDLHFALRSFLKAPGFTAVAILTLALGIAANTTVFSWVDSLLLRPFPGAADQGRLAIMQTVTAGAPNGANQLSYPDYRDYASNLKSLSGLAAHNEEVLAIGDASRGEAVWGEMVSSNYFDVLGVTPTFGRAFIASDTAVAIISDGLWRRRFRADPKTVGSTVRVNQHELTIVGVAPREFRGTMPGLCFDLWIPLTNAVTLGILDQAAFDSRSNQWLYAVARLAPGASITGAHAEATAYARALEAAYPRTNRGIGISVSPVWEFPSAAPGLLLRPLRILMAISLLLLLIVCANVANLLLARALARRKEISIRLAIGAQASHIARQLFTETLLLAIAAAGVGLLLAAWMADSLPSLVPNVGVRVAIGFALSWRVLAFTVAICVAAAMFSGLAPALWCLRTSQHTRARSVLIIFEVAVATLAVVFAGLFVRSFSRAQSIDPGFEREHLALARFYLVPTGFTPDQVQQFAVRLRDHLRTVPGVTHVAYADRVPLGTSSGPYNTIEVQGYVPRRDESMQINRYRISAGYFVTMRTPLVEGREFLDSDDSSAPRVIIVNQTFARRYFGGGSALGRRVRIGSDWSTVIGVARDSKYFDVGEAPRPHFFVSIRQRRPGDQLYFLLRTAGNPSTVLAGLRREIAAVDSRASAVDLMPFHEWSDVTLLPHKAAATLAGGMGLIALLIAAVGLYSVMAYAVSQRTREIGIRMALGARPINVLRDVLVRGMGLTAAGLAIGITIALAATRIVAGMLIHVAPTDPATFAVAAAFLSAVALLACYVPALRATHVNPIEALHCE